MKFRLHKDTKTLVCFFEDRKGFILRTDSKHYQIGYLSSSWNYAGKNNKYWMEI